MRVEIHDEAEGSGEAGEMGKREDLMDEGRKTGKRQMEEEKGISKSEEREAAA